MTGLLLLDKPEGITSFGAVARVRRVLQTKKVGHTGTLDPMATGVLPVLLGGATRFAALLPCHNKAYVAGLRLGVATDTYDSTGKILAERPVTAAREDVERALEPLRGSIMQVPPMYSALQKDGVRLYDLARQGIEIERAPRAVQIFLLELLEGQSGDDYMLRVECTAGTYVRSLIRDLGESLGCGACMTSLRRVQANGFGIAQCKTLEEIASADVIPIDEALRGYPAVEVTPAQAVRFRNGGALMRTRTALPLSVAEGLFRVYANGGFVGLGRVQGD
ncbi:MAG: tRNA pseudouridine(55) synthase TruB, partial [Oscillospiraceae bacterium]|nr:tRNA pseudouridine(55) synthase TruB [Oscillospiraceae bacterium]